ncbi:glycoside hydrolase family 5 protein [Flavobacterium sp. CSZ]|uniref:glycoside hydrolase family 5 protein n=1 Tax=Flavobacterium sp. CSZ TaxID=2783791 RepID=UPI00188CF28D|nr:glycoside hydrolase family 5 protein [Flavobacterium sp. CSZ]MBF4487787.1 glycoside hydrolase family 5 protein [Flavobacterium sp. CSZ]
MIKKVKVLLFVSGFFMSLNAFAQLPTAPELAKRMHVGVNLGNTLEAICSEDAWGAGKTSQKLIDSIKTAGFNTIRIPTAWFCHSDTISSTISPQWMARVREVVDYCIKDDLYVIINMHWDKGWLENRVDPKQQAKVNERQKAYWTQIAEYFKQYDEHLLFAGANEPHASNALQMSVLLSYYQTFINAVRATGGNNTSRTLIIQGPETDIEKTLKLMNTLPKDKINNRLMVEVHFYSPFQFCLMNDDAQWGKMFYYWGKDFHSKTDTERNSTWGEEDAVDKLFSDLKKKFVDKGIPVILGEFGAYRRKIEDPENQQLNYKSVEHFNKYVVKSCLTNGIIPYYWDTPMNLLNRDTAKVLDKGVISAMFQGAKEAKAESYSKKTKKK